MKALVLGGTLEARAISTALAQQGYGVTLALKGLTSRPRVPAGVTHREGGFGGPAGLADYLRQTSQDLLIDATHPFAARMSWNAHGAAARSGVPTLALQRTPWQRMPGDDWRRFDTLDKAALALRPLPAKRILLALGGQGAERFRRLPQHQFLARVLATSRTNLATRYGHRWPGLTLQRFDHRPTVAEEMATLQRFGADMLIMRNAGGSLDAKLSAARRLQMPIWLISRPAMPPLRTFRSVAALLTHLQGR